MKYITTVIRVLFLGVFVFLILTGKTMLWLALFVAGLIGAVFFGRVYCGYACPMNTLMIIAERAAKRLNLQTSPGQKWLTSGKFAWFALGGTIVTMLLAKRLLKIKLPILLIWLGVSVIVTLRYKPAVFHNLICPFGALLKVFSTKPLWAKKVKKQDCIGCKLCEKVCPSAAVEVRGEDKKAVIDISLCHQCSNCQQVCPQDAIARSIN